MLDLTGKVALVMGCGAVADGWGNGRATATLLARRVPTIMLTAVAIGIASGVIGLLISYHHSTAAGATMALKNPWGHLLTDWKGQGR